MIEKNQGCLQTFESVYHDKSSKYASVDNLRVSGIHSEEPNTESLTVVFYT